MLQDISSKPLVRIVSKLYGKVGVFCFCETAKNLEFSNFQFKIQKGRSRQHWPNLPSLLTQEDQERQQDRQKTSIVREENLGTMENR